jgi:hypothetical protein
VGVAVNNVPRQTTRGAYAKLRESSFGTAIRNPPENPRDAVSIVRVHERDHFSTDEGEGI